MSRTTATDLLAAIDIAPDEARALSRYVTVIDVEPGQVLCEQGRTRSQMAWLLAGSAAVVRGGVRIATLSAGDVAGEITAVADVPAYTADVTFLEPSTVAVLSVPEWRQVAGRVPELRGRLLEIAASRRGR
jgi:CRP-like cAMP-binding protein